MKIVLQPAARFHSINPLKFNSTAGMAILSPASERMQRRAGEASTARRLAR
jgi:hypothetical protein